MNIGDYSEWTFTNHARLRAAERSYALADVLKAATHPEVSYSQPSRGVNYRIHQRGRIAVAVDLGTRTIITVLLRHHDSWIDTEEGPVVCQNKV